MLNQITIMGRLTKEPGLRYTTSQVPVASFTLAVDRDYTEKGMDRQTDFIDCVAWRHSANFVHQYFSKGSMAVVSGRLQMRNWTDKHGNKRVSAEVVAENVYFGEAKRREENRGSFQAAGRPVDVDATGFSGYTELEDADEGKLPF